MRTQKLLLGTLTMGLLLGSVQVLAAPAAPAKQVVVSPGVTFTCIPGKGMQVKNGSGKVVNFSSNPALSPHGPFTSPLAPGNSTEFGPGIKVIAFQTFDGKTFRCECSSAPSVPCSVF